MSLKEVRWKLEGLQKRAVNALNEAVLSRSEVSDAQFPVSAMVKVSSGRSERLEINKDQVVINDVDVKLVAERNDSTGLVDELKLSRGTVALKAQFLEGFLQQDLSALSYVVRPKTDEDRIKIAIDGINSLFQDRVVRPLRERNIIDENGTAKGVLTANFQDKQGVKVYLDMEENGNLTIRRAERARSKTMTLHSDENNNYSLPSDRQAMAKSVTADTLLGLFETLQSENDLCFRIARKSENPEVSSAVRAVEKPYVLGRDDETIKRAASQDAREVLGMAPL